MQVGYTVACIQDLCATSYGICVEYLVSAVYVADIRKIERVQRKFTITKRPPECSIIYAIVTDYTQTKSR